MKPREPFVWFIDRSLGRIQLATVLRALGELVEVHDDHFAKNTPDTEWLAAVAARGWVVLTKDPAIRTNEVERAALLSAAVVAFMLGRGNLDAPAMGAAFTQAMSAMKKALRRFEPPVIATVHATGEVTVLWAEGRRLATPLRVKPSKRGR